MEEILKQLHEISSTSIYMSSDRYEWRDMRSTYHVRIERKTDGSKLEIYKSSTVSFADALDAAWDEFKAVINYGIPKAALYPNLLEVQASAHSEI